MKGAITETNVVLAQPEFLPGENASVGITETGIRIYRVNGQDMFSKDDVQRYVCEVVAKLPSETRPAVLAAQDARKIVDDLTSGLKQQVEGFRDDTAAWIKDIREVRFALVAEVAKMTTELKDLRRFFIGDDYQLESTRLREFVDLCERLAKLKTSGVLDHIADTMIRLASR